MRHALGAGRGWRMESLNEIEKIYVGGLDKLMEIVFFSLFTRYDIS
ncbi:MAG: hypothetical protein LW630_05715 [Saprospiraceae bacterium]|nr:hypothetical protein [Saprospiraceae bacterium]